MAERFLKDVDVIKIDHYGNVSSVRKFLKVDNDRGGMYNWGQITKEIQEEFVEVSPDFGALNGRDTHIYIRKSYLIYLLKREGITSNDLD